MTREVVDTDEIGFVEEAVTSLLVEVDFDGVDEVIGLVGPNVERDKLLLDFTVEELLLLEVVDELLEVFDPPTVVMLVLSDLVDIFEDVDELAEFCCPKKMPTVLTISLASTST